MGGGDKWGRRARGTRDSGALDLGLAGFLYASTTAFRIPTDPAARDSNLILLNAFNKIRLSS